MALFVTIKQGWTIVWPLFFADSTLIWTSFVNWSHGFEITVSVTSSLEDSDEVGVVDVEFENFVAWLNISYFY